MRMPEDYYVLFVVEDEQTAYVEGDPCTEA